MHPSYTIWEFGEYLMKDMFRCQYYGCKNMRNSYFPACDKEHGYLLRNIKFEIKRLQDEPFTRYWDVEDDNGNTITREFSWTSRPFTDYDLTIDELNYYAKLV